ncbi:MAG: N-acetyltransferase [Bacteroidetes bacterium]|nr:MAG: N-acetyltransferase [Bacteroidota bacterium]TAG87403.1 MAG: N-acetyltransferase [Bacteroidota bacterium]
MLENIIQTERLILREFTLLDDEFIVKLLNTSGWLYFIGDKNVKNSVDAKYYLENTPLKSYKENGFGLSLIALKDSLLPIGMCGLVKRESLDYPDIGFALLDEYMGKGYAFEIAHATMIYAKEILKISKILAIATPDNKYSIQLLKKIGLTFQKMIILPHNSEEIMLFSTI